MSDTRVSKLTKDVDKEFHEHELKQKRSGMEETAPEEGDLFSKKCENLLLPSHLQIMEEVFTNMDKYGDQVLKRCEFLLGLRTNEKVVTFIDADAV